MSETYLLDASALVAMTNPDHVHHGRARQWFSGVAEWATTPLTEAAFIRLMLNPAVTGAPRIASEVLGVLRALRARAGHAFVPDDSSLAEPSIELAGLIGHQQVTHLHLVNLAARHDAMPATLDSRIAKALVRSEQRRVHLI